MSLVVPAVLPYSREEFREKLDLLSKIPFVTRIQIDVVDGKFSSPASWPYNSPSELKEMVEKIEILPHLENIEYEADLMCFGAESVAEAWLDVGVSRLTFHAESNATDLPRLITSARNRYDAGGLSPIVLFGLALNITSDLALIESCIDKVEYVQFMGIAKIGRQGQPLDRRVFEKIILFHARHPETPIQVDGGVSLENAKKLVASGVSNLVIGSAIFRSSNPTDAVAKFEEVQSFYGV